MVDSIELFGLWYVLANELSLLSIKPFGCQPFWYMYLVIRLEIWKQVSGSLLQTLQNSDTITTAHHI